MNARAIAAALLALPLGGTAFVQSGEVRLTPADIETLAKGGAELGTSGVAGIQTTRLYGDPSKPGPYAIEIRVPPHARIAAHDHRDTRTATVVGGTWYFGYGAVAEEAKAKALPPGSFYTEPAGVPHFALTRDETAVVHVHGWGPTSTRFTQP